MKRSHNAGGKNNLKGTKAITGRLHRKAPSRAKRYPKSRS